MTTSANRRTVSRKKDPYFLAPRHEVKRGEPAWDVALLFPEQGEWTEEEYLALTDSTSRLVELVDGCLEILPMPDLYHQGIVKFLFLALHAFASAHKIGEAFFAPSPVRLWQGRMREPDIFLLSEKHLKDRRKPPDGALLAMEIVSPGRKNRKRDLDIKRKNYARAQIQEYWIVDPKEETVTVLVLGRKTYKLHGKFKPGQQATSKLLAGFSVDVPEVFAAGEGK